VPPAQDPCYKALISYPFYHDQELSVDINTIIQALGGLSMFLLAMRLMTEGLTLFAGNRLKHLLGNWTSTPWRGVGVGILVTGLVQSSSAVTVATIGFVNAGILSLRQAMGVIFGTNVGTTMTAWLVSLVGFGFKIEALALPILVVGVGLRLMASSTRWKGLGDALTGFGLFFLGLDLLKEAFEGIASSFSANLGAGVSTNWAGMILIGFVATLLTQSSSAAIAIILTASAGGIIGFEGAAAAVIGANLGTTSTAALATFKATPAAKRLALSHIGFNLITGIVALCMLPLMLGLVNLLGDALDIESTPTALLALFHTLFNLLGVIIMLPLANRFASLLERLFHSAEEDIERPHYLDATLSGTPVLAVSALKQELMRLSDILVCLLRDALSGPHSIPELKRRAEAIHTLGAAIANFITGIRPDAMEHSTANELASALYAARYYQESAQLAPGLRRLAQDQVLLSGAEKAAVSTLLQQAERCLEPELSGEHLQARERVEALRNAHRDARRQLLEAAVRGNLQLVDLETMLEGLDFSRRAIELGIKAGLLFHTSQNSEAVAIHPVSETDLTKTLNTDQYPNLPQASDDK